MTNDDEQAAPPGADADQERVEGRDVWVTRDEQGVTAVADEREAATPARVAPDDADVNAPAGAEPDE